MSLSNPFGPRHRSLGLHLSKLRFILEFEISHLSAIDGVRIMSKSIVHCLYVSEGDEPKASGPPRHRVLHDHCILHRTVDLEILPKLLYESMHQSQGSTFVIARTVICAVRQPTDKYFPKLKIIKYTYSWVTFK